MCKGDPDLSICMVNWNAGSELLACLDSIRPGLSTIRYEVVVVDNASSDGSPELIGMQYPWVRQQINTANLGFAKAANQAISMSSGRYVLLLNPDTEADFGALDSLIAFADTVPDAGIIGCRILNSDRSLQYSCRRFPTLVAGMLRNTPLAKLCPNSRHVGDYLMQDWDHASVRDVDWVSGAAMLIRREAIQGIGCLDERFFMYCEDMDLCKRAGESGWRVVYYPHATIVHAIGRSSSKNATRMILAFHQSMYRYYAKHHASIEMFVPRSVVAIALVIRASMVLAVRRLRRAEPSWNTDQQSKPSVEVGVPADI